MFRRLLLIALASCASVPDRHGLLPEHLFVWVGEEEAPELLSAHVGIAVDGGFLDVLTGEILETAHTWRSRPLEPDEARVGQLVARVEEIPPRGPPDEARSLGGTWTVGPIEAVAPGKAKLHGRWSSVEELRRVWYDKPTP